MTVEIQEQREKERGGRTEPLENKKINPVEEILIITTFRCNTSFNREIAYCNIYSNLILDLQVRGKKVFGKC